METAHFFLTLFLILLSGRFFGEVAVKLGIPSVIGELFAGVFLGPSLLHLVDLSEPIKLLAEIGIILLLFEVGLETDVVKLKSAGIKPFIVAFGGVAAPFVLGFLVSYYLFHLTLIISILVGSTLTATSIGITMRVLSDLKQQSSKEAQIVLGAAVIDDVIGIILLSIVYEFSLGKEIDLFSIAKVALYISLFLITAPFIAKFLSTLIEKFHRKSTIPGLIPSLVVSLILFFAWIADLVGSPVLLGGFAAGLAFSPQFTPTFSSYLKVQENFTHHIEKKMKPIIHLFVPIFFVSVGLSLNLREINLESSFVWLISLTLIVVAVLGKLSSGFLLFGEKRAIQWAVGIAMIPRGEVGLIFAEMGKSNAILNEDLYAALLIVIVFTTVTAPFALRLFYKNKNELN